LPAASIVASGATLNFTNYQYNSALSGTGSLTLADGTVMNLNYGVLSGNPSAPAIAVAGGFSASGTNVINITGSGFLLGQFPLITYTGTSVPTNTFVLGFVPAGVTAILSNNQANPSLDLVVVTVGNLLNWHGANADNSVVLPDWDIDTSANWYDANLNLLKYMEYGGHAFGDLVAFGDYGYNVDGTNRVNLPGRVVPSSVTIEGTLAHELTGTGGIDGATSLVMNNFTSCLLGTSNNYAGGTFVNAGTLTINNDYALGAASGALTMGGGVLQVAGDMATARRATFSAASTVETLTGVTGRLQLDATLPGGGALTKMGNGLLELSGGAGTNNIGDLTMSQGSVKVVNGNVRASATQGNTRVDLGANLEIAAGGVLTVANGVNAWFPLGDSTGTTNTLTISGTLVVANNWGIEAPRNGTAILTINSGSMSVNDIGGVGLIMGDQAGSEFGTLNLNGGTLTVNLIRAFNGVNTFYFNGGTLRRIGANVNFFPSSAALTTQVRNGGAIVDTAGLNASIAEPLDHSTVVGDNAIDGGLTKIGNGTLNLNAVNTYNGPTIITGGTLGGIGTLAGALTNNATLAPGNNGIGTLTVAGNIALNAGSTSVFDVNGTSLTKDTVVAGAGVVYGGTLSITPAGAFTVGQQFQLFSGAGATNASNFASVTGSPGSGMAFSFTNGVLSVVPGGPSAPAHLTNSYSGGVLHLAWPAGEGWRLQVQTNDLTTGLSTNWQTLTDGSVSSADITVSPAEPTVFYRLIYP